MEMKNQNSCDHVGLFTAGADRLVGFYTRKLGFQKTKEEILPRDMTRAIFGVAADCRFLKLQAGDAVIEIFEPLRGRVTKRRRSAAGINHFGFVVTDRKAFLRRLRERKVPVLVIDRNGRSTYFISDPDGNRIEIRG
jgi:catechol 2,3-dioxygenase-like lactoylglutathione lyase family enzyme